MATMNVKDAAGATVAVEKPLAPARAAAAASRPVVLSTEDKAVIDAIAASVAGATPAGTNNIGDVDVLTVPADPFGANADAASATGSISAKLRALVTAIGTTAWDLGLGAAGSRTQRVAIATDQLAQNRTTAGALSDGFTQVDVPTDGTQATRLGGLTETAPASDTASSGLNGRLQRIAQNITTLIAATLKVALQAATSGGLSRSRTLIPNNTTAIVVKSGAGQLYKVRATNNSGTIAYIKIYDATSATAGSGTPVDTIMIPSSTSGTGIVDTTDVGAVHVTGITYIVTTGIGDADATAPAANAYIVTFFYK